MVTMPWLSPRGPTDRVHFSQFCRPPAVDRVIGMPEHAHLALKLLGERTATRVTVRADSGVAIPIYIASQKARALLYFVAMQKEHSTSRSRCATLLWGDRPDALARHNLRQTLVSLRACFAVVMPDVIILEGDIIRLRKDRLAVDAVAFATMARSKELSNLERAGALYDGEFLAGEEVIAAAFCDWVNEEQVRLQNLASYVFRECAQQWDAGGDGERAIDAATRLTGLDPLREDWQRLLLRIYARYRGREAALAHAWSLVALLRRELGVDPAPATKALIVEIERGALSIEPATGGDPAESTPPINGSQLVESPQEVFASQASIAKPSVAVLPFHVLGGAWDENYFAEGLHIEITMALSNIRAISVASRDSALAHASDAIDVRQVGSDMEVDYVIKGAIRQRDNRVRVTIGVVNTHTGYHLFSRSYDAMLQELFAAQDEIAAKFSALVEPHIYAVEGRQAMAKPIDALDARGCIMRALALINIRSKRNYTLAQKLLKRVVSLKPDWPQAYSLISYIATLEVLYGWQSRENLRFAHNSAVEAILRDPEEPWAHFALGFVHLQSRATEQALERFIKARELNPICNLVHTHLGSAYSYLGRTEDALRQVEEAERLASREFFVGVNNCVRANAYFAAGKHEAAAAFARRSVHDSPGMVTSQRQLVVNHFLDGELDAAKAELRRLRELVPGLSLHSIKEALAYCRETDKERFLDAFHRLGVK
jgi:TolB-like protein/DNA-binding SARP family transcriptional activator/Tfp pilus assembly protein PilF